MPLAAPLRRAAKAALGCTVLLACLRGGERIAPYLPVPLPGALVGMLLFATFALLHRGSVALAAHHVSDLLLRRYALFFVPAGVGVITQTDVLRANWLAISVSLAASSVLAVTVTALTMRAVLGLGKLKLSRSFVKQC